MPPGLALQAVGMALQANIDFLKIDRIVVTFLKITRIFLNQDVPRRGCHLEYCVKVCSKQEDMNSRQAQISTCVIGTISMHALLE